MERQQTSPIAKVYSRFVSEEPGTWSHALSNPGDSWELRAQPMSVPFNTMPILIWFVKYRKTLLVSAVSSFIIQCILRMGGSLGARDYESNFKGEEHHVWERHWAVMVMEVLNSLILFVVMLHYTNRQLVWSQLWAWETVVVIGYYLSWYATLVLGEACTFPEHFGARRRAESAVDIAINTPLLVIAACFDSVQMPKIIKCCVIVLMIVERIWQYGEHRGTSGIFSDKGVCDFGGWTVESRDLHSFNLQSNITIIIFLAKSLKAYCLGEHFALIKPRFTLTDNSTANHLGPGVSRASRTSAESFTATTVNFEESKPPLPSPVEAIGMPEDSAGRPSESFEAGPLGGLAALGSADDVRERALLPAHPVPASPGTPIVAPASEEVHLEEEVQRPPRTEATPVTTCATGDGAPLADVMPQPPDGEALGCGRAPVSCAGSSTPAAVDEPSALTANAAPEATALSAGSESMLEVMTQARDDLSRQKKAYQIDLAILRSQLKYLSAEVSLHGGAPDAEEVSTPASYPEHDTLPELEDRHFWV